MKKLLYLSVFLLLGGFVQAQPVFDLGIKAGISYSNMSIDDVASLGIDSESITKMHWGAFGRVGFGRIYVQPEIYFSKKGGDLSLDYNGIIKSGDFDYKNVDVPVLLGFKIVKSSLIDLRIMAGPVFSFVVDADYPSELESYFKEDYMNDHLFGIQYGVGIDVLCFTLDARMEHEGNIYEQPDVIKGKANTFMLTLGFKIL